MSTVAPERPSSTKPATLGAGRRAGAAGRSFAVLLILPVVLVLLWALVATLVDSLVFPGPLEALGGTVDDLGDEGYRASMLTSLRLLLVAWLMAAVVGGLIGFLLGQSAFWTRVFSTPLFAFYSIPKVTLYPVFLLLLGLGEASRVAFAFFHGVFPMALLVMGATAALDPKLVRLSAALELSWWQRLTKVVLPALMPTVLLALRISFGLTFLGLVLAEMFSSDTGLGHELVANVANVRVDRIAGQVVLIALLAIGPVLALLGLERRVKARAGIR
ncbi:ABC transporter permease subunit [Nocardioides zeae]|uniref:ABC transporter permease subunit n=1 Tax=Nocardioides imazamoxiresistens TaxID=3231893 RepID=A0ABU3PWN6_9ACTN|nr:ABC transporter permease subunit [Nocardioides zeae]MDT9593645.1 ABC transporter permease subunit [Nocardioides zeae]